VSILSLPQDGRNTRFWASSKYRYQMQRYAALTWVLAKGDPVAQFLMSWLLVGGRFRIYAINGIGRRKGRVIEVEVIATGERFHGSARRMERLVRALQGSDDDRRHESGPDTWQDVVAVDLALRKRT
jgi:hypothetical protein